MARNISAPTIAALLLVSTALIHETAAAQRGGGGGGRGGGGAAAPPPPPGATTQPFPGPIDPTAGLIAVDVVEFASVPDIDGIAARMMLLVDEPGTRRMFVNDMRGPIYSVSYDGRTVQQYVNINDPQWGVNVNSQGRERGMQSFAFHPQFGQQGTPGYGHFYTWTDSQNNQVAADFMPIATTNTHHTVLHEWVARNAAAATYDGAAPRELFRFQQPYSNHNGGMISFNPLAQPGQPDFGLLFVGIGDGGSGGDPQNAAQNLSNGFGKIFRIDPLGNNSRNKKYGIPASNPFASDNDPNTLDEIYAYGVRNPQRFGWDSRNGSMFFSDIGQNIVEKVSLVRPGANLGWNVWEGSYRYLGRGGVEGPNARSDRNVLYPIVEYAHGDPLLQGNAAVSGVIVYRTNAIPALQNKVIFSDFPSGEIFYFDADNLPQGGNTGMHRILLRQGGGEPQTALALIKAKNTAQGKNPATRADLRFGAGPNGQVLLINKADGTIRLLVPPGR
jgi:glucose/arabinose dehydrogenase